MADNISLSPIKDMELRASRIPGVVSLAQGVPSFDTPETIKQAAIRAIERGKVAKYSLAPGLLELREVITQKLEEENKFYDFEEEVIVTAGSIEAITATMLTILSPGDEVLVPDPTYTSYQPAIKVAGGVPVFVPLDEKNHWSFDIAELEKRITPKTKALLFCNPNNPTGTIFTRNQLHAVAQMAIKHDFYILSDEVYKDFIFDGFDEGSTFGNRKVEPSRSGLYSLAEMRGIRDRLVYIFSFSKAYAMTGWRIAYLATHHELAKKILGTHDVLVTCAPVVSQYAALGALEMAEKDLAGYHRIYKARRDLICERLDKLAHVFEYQKPDSAYFVFPKIKKEILDKMPNISNSKDFAIELLEKAHVATVPGNAFGPSGENHIRMCFGRSEEDINEAFDRLEKYFKVFL
ncbi:MAG: aminotransferase class I/II-fold pyridoxal phosphate-dependent enzyme [Candidatus Moranbacteria bacterium]|nr:aminotransferase class I/II-fold pyridoxal phosphate-dependent enzyme [Candidatus Moranbacteria bacterium]